MILRSLKLENFRSYKSFDINLKPITVFVGPNGVGKTNLIEAIYFLALGKSYRVKNDSDMILWGNDYCRVTGKTDTKNLEIFVSLLPEKAKSIKINDRKIKNAELFGKLKIIIFSPESIDIITGAPKERRKFLDVILCQTDKKYLYNLLELQKVLRNRNHLLFNIKIGHSKSDELIFWNNKLVELSRPIIAGRTKIIEIINNNIADLYKKVSGQKEYLKVNYISSFGPLDYFFDLLVKNQNKEIKECATLFGPHRDNLEFTLDDRNVNVFASRGEIRSIIFALKVAEMEFIKKSGEKPLLLLDDIFSELDSKRRQKLSEIILSELAVITTTDSDFLSYNLQKQSKIVELKADK